MGEEVKSPVETFEKWRCQIHIGLHDPPHLESLIWPFGFPHLPDSTRDLPGKVLAPVIGDVEGKGVAKQAEILDGGCLIPGGQKV